VNPSFAQEIFDISTGPGIATVLSNGEKDDLGKKSMVFKRVFIDEFSLKRESVEIA